MPVPVGYEIRPLVLGDATALAAAYDRNRAHLAPWEPVRPDGWFTTAGQEAEITRLLDRAAAGQLDPHVLVHVGSGDVVGRVNLNNIIRLVLQTASVGYWVDHAHLRRGLAAAAVRYALVRAAELGLHRVEAGTRLENEASQAVLRSCGFEEYGLARGYLFVNGAWRDHRLFQVLLGDAPPHGEGG